MTTDNQEIKPMYMYMVFDKDNTYYGSSSSEAIALNIASRKPGAKAVGGLWTPVSQSEIKPVRAWAVVGSEIHVDLIYMLSDKERARSCATSFKMKVVEVLITPVSQPESKPVEEGEDNTPILLSSETKRKAIKAMNWAAEELEKDDAIIESLEAKVKELSEALKDAQDIIGKGVDACTRRMISGLEAKVLELEKLVEDVQKLLEEIPYGAWHDFALTKNSESHQILIAYNKQVEAIQNAMSKDKSD